MTTTDWYRLYKEGWQGEIVPEAFAHPAKYSRALIRHIYQHMIDEGWVTAGDAVCDPFGGVALGGLDAMRHGLHWIGCELEPKFVDLGNQNIDKWNAQYAGHFPTWGSATLLQGDSRQLSAVLSEQLEACVSSPPYAEARIGQESGQEHCGRGDQYGGIGGQLGSMKAEQFQAAVSSPPFLQQSGGTKITATEGPLADPALHDRHKAGNWSEKAYGQMAGQLGAMKAEGFEAAVSSPPFENSLDRGVVDPTARREYARSVGESNAEHISPIDMERIGKRDQEYGDTAGNIGNSAGDDFWLAARAIVEQVYMVLKPGGHATWVVKSFVKNKEIVDFPGQWQQLCEAVGFETLHYHRAWLVENRGAQYGLFGELHEKIVERKSFFRRLSEKRGSPRIDYEVVLCMEKPKGDE